MRTEKSRDTLKSATLSRARMFIKSDLGWVRGFPLASAARKVEWVIVPREDGHPLERRSLSREDIQKAVYTYNRLVRHFPRALPRAVEDIRSWKRGLPLLFDFLKARILADKPFPQSVLSVGGVFPSSAVQTAADLRRRFPFLERFVDALGYILFLHPEELAPALKWTGLHAVEIENLRAGSGGDEGFLRQISLWELSRRAGYRDAEFLAGILGDKRVYVYATEGWSVYLTSLRSAIVDSALGPFRRGLPFAPKPGLADKLFEFIGWTLRQTQDVRRRALLLLKIVLDADFLTPWESAWRKLEETPWVRQPIARKRRPVPLETEIARIKARFGALLSDPPPEIRIAKLLEHVRFFSAPSRAPGFPLISRALQVLPPVHCGALVRAAFLHDWAEEGDVPSPLFAEALRRFSHYTSANRGSVAWLKPWEDLLKKWAAGSYSIWSLLGQVIHNAGGPSEIGVCFDVLNRASAAGPEGIGYEEASCLVGLVAALRNPDLALEYAKSMAKEGATVSQPSESVVLAAHALCTEASEFGRLFKRLDKLTLDNREMKAVLRLDRKLRDKGWAGIIKEAVLERDVAAVLAIAERWEALISLGGECDPPERSHPGDAAGWMNQYPPEFRGPLAALSCLKPGAERTARRIFGEDYISPEALDREIAVLEAKVKTAPASGVLAKRLANLRERRASAVSITPKKSFRLKKRLNRAVRTEVFSRWARRLDEEFLENLGKPLGTASLPPEFILPGFLPVLTSIMGLSKPFRELGLELLRRRCAPPPWNLYDHPANRAFLERVRKNGVDPDPWIERGASRIVRAENGKRLRIALEDDPLEVFQMGAYFHTCLKPGGVNFYSVVSNAADINKRVLFARDEDGKVAGRCLFALTDGGGILTFHPYSHDKGLGFSGIVSRYASELASRMKTAVVFSGTVECLVAPKWYDDGPRDTGFRFPFLEEESDFRSQLKTLKPAELPDKVKAAVGPLAPNSLTLAPIIMLPELKERPELLVPLQPLLERCDDLPVEVWSRAADLARKAGRLDQARRILRKFIIPCELRQLKSEYIREVDEQVIELALDIDPSATLRLFRQTRPRGVRRDEHEPPYRKKHIVSAHERLGRDTVARRLGGKEE